MTVAVIFIALIIAVMMFFVFGIFGELITIRRMIEAFMDFLFDDEEEEEVKDN